MGLPREQCAELRKGLLLYCCNQVWVTNGGRILWNVICCLRNIHDLLSDGKTPCERRFGEPFNEPIIPFGAMVKYHPIFAKDQSRLHQFGVNVLPGIFLGYVMHAGKSGKETFLPQTLKSWRRWTHQKSTQEGSMQWKC